MEMLSPKPTIVGNGQKIIQGKLYLDERARISSYNIHITYSDGILCFGHGCKATNNVRYCNYTIFEMFTFLYLTLGYICMIIVPFHIEESEEMELIHFCSYFRDLSGNQLTGPIPNFGSMKWLQTLKLSGNQLSGPSPVFLDGSSSQGLANLTALTTL
jgi:hypothetical protein